MEQNRIDQIEHLAGIVTALRGCCMALIAAHPQRPAVHAALLSAKERAMANALPTGTSDAALQAAEQTYNGLIQVASD